MEKLKRSLKNILLHLIILWNPNNRYKWFIPKDIETLKNFVTIKPSDTISKLQSKTSLKYLQIYQLLCHNAVGYLKIFEIR